MIRALGLALTLLTVAGCVRLGYQPDALPSVPSDGRAAELDSGFAGRDVLPHGDGPANDACCSDSRPGDLLAMLPPFSAPTLIAALSDPSASDDDPSLTADQLELYFNSNRVGGSGGLDIWRSVRTTTSDPWGAPTAVAELNTSLDESTPEVLPDGLTIYFSSTRAGGQGSYDIWFSTRIGRTAPWSAPKVVAELSSSEVDAAAAVNAAGLTLVMYSTRQGTSDLFVSSRTSLASAWGAPQLITELNTSDAELSPCLAADGLTIFFESDCTGSSSQDIYFATRPTPTGPFSAAQRVNELNSPAYDGDPWISADARHMVFCSAKSGDLEIYEAWR